MTIEDGLEMGSMTLHTLAANVFQLGMLGAGISLLLLWINYLKANRDRGASEEREESALETTVASATRNRTGP